MELLHTDLKFLVRREIADDRLSGGFRCSLLLGFSRYVLT